ncbi:MAG: metal ABC transporter substrate-binding protein [Candidatus Hermodarchaeota archaeon]
MEKCRINFFFVLVSVILITSLTMNLQLTRGLKESRQELILNTRNAHQAGVNVVTTISIIADWAQQVSGNLAEVTSIVTGLENPHTYEPTSSEIQAVAGADLFIRMGIPGLEPWVQSTIDSTGLPDSKILALVNFTAQEYMEPDPILDNTKNPHVWMSPVNAKDMVTKIYNNFAEIDSVNDATYLQNANDYKTELDSLLGRINSAKNTLQGTKVVVHHPSFVYLFNLLGIERLAAIEEHEGEEPSAEHIAEIIQLMKDENCRLVVNQPQLEESEIIEIARETGAKIADLTPLLGTFEFESGTESINTYIDMIDFNINAIQNPHDPPAATTPGFTVLVFLMTIPVLLYVHKKRK